jgi:hypothetical protein
VELENLERAFPPRPIEPAHAFAEWGGTYVDAGAFRDGVRGKRWTELEASFLERHHDALVFFGSGAECAAQRRMKVVIALGVVCVSALAFAGVGDDFKNDLRATDRDRVVKAGRV